MVGLQRATQWSLVAVGPTYKTLPLCAWKMLIYWGKTDREPKQVASPADQHSQHPLVANRQLFFSLFFLLLFFFWNQGHSSLFIFFIHFLFSLSISVSLFWIRLFDSCLFSSFFSSAFFFCSFYLESALHSFLILCSFVFPFLFSFLGDQLPPPFFFSRVTSTNKSKHT